MKLGVALRLSQWGRKKIRIGSRVLFVGFLKVILDEWARGPLFLIGTRNGCVSKMGDLRIVIR